MVLSVLVILLCAFISEPIHGLCQWEWNAGEITDIQTPTPLTFAWTATVLGCLSTPTTLIESDTATLGTVSFTAYPVTWAFDVATGTITVSYTYPDLIVTMLTPGENILDNYVFSPSTLPTVGTGGQVFMSVASTAFVASAPSTSSPETTATLSPTRTKDPQNLSKGITEVDSTTGYTVSTPSVVSETISSSSIAPPVNSGLSIGAVVGILIAAFIVIALLGVGMVLCYIKRRHTQPAQLPDRDQVGAPSGYEFETFKEDDRKFHHDSTHFEYDEMPSGAIRTPL